MNPMSPFPIIVRQVWQHNLAFEVDLIQRSLWRYQYVSMDTKFPGTVYAHPGRHYSTLSPSEFYADMKKNVDAMKLIQLGLTICDGHRNLPNFGTAFQYIWEFNFCGFDPEHDLHDPESIALLKRQGIDFTKNRALGIDPWDFANLFKIWGWESMKMKWITFHGPYDFAYLIKMLTWKELPDDLEGFMDLVQFYFGKEVYDLKILIQVMDMGLHGGLDQIGQSLNLNRAVGKSHQAGSDSLLTMQLFLRLMKDEMKNFIQLIYGLC